MEIYSIFGLIVVVLTFIFGQDRTGKTETQRIKKQLAEDSLKMWAERLRTGKENRPKYYKINFHTGKRNYQIDLTRTLKSVLFKQS